MSHVKWVATDRMTEQVRQMLAAFESSFVKSNTSYTVSHEDKDAVFVTIYGSVCPYQIVHFINTHPDIYVEIEARARQHVEFRMFGSDWLREHELPRMHAIASAPARNGEPPRHVRMSVRREVT